MADLKMLSESIIKGDQKTAVEITKAAISENMAPEGGHGWPWDMSSRDFSPAFG
jgi:hypothetical protein